MSKDDFIVSQDQRPAWFNYPYSFERIVDQSMVNLTPWHILPKSEVVVRLKGLKERYPTRELFPFAYRQDNDDTACWSAGKGEKVYIIHDFASAGWEGEGAFDDVWSWFRSAIEETIEWD